MSFSVVKRDDAKMPIQLALDELDRVKLKQAIDAEGRKLASGLAGTVVLCHGTKAYEIEFDGVQDVFGIPAEYLEKI